MVEFVNEPVIVEARLRENETPLPLAFVWRGRRYQIQSWGRETVKSEEEGAVHCYLVQTAGLEGWELCLDTERAQWQLTRHWAPKPPMV